MTIQVGQVGQRVLYRPLYTNDRLPATIVELDGSSFVCIAIDDEVGTQWVNKDLLYAP